MADLGSIALRLAMVLAVYASLGSILGERRRLPELIRSARYASYLTLPVLLIAAAALVAAFVTHDFQIRYVAMHSNHAMEPIYTWVAFYAGNEGSILYIALALAGLATIAFVRAPLVLESSLPYVIAITMFVLAFLLGVMVFLADPFTVLAVTPPDGQGMNPLLTHPGMFIHPPLLMAGLVAITIPFSFAIGTILSGKFKDEWVDTGRTWGLVAWGLLGIGLLLGAWWAYTILGWGGYWAWDPVENAALMPWLGLTAFLHSIMVQKRRGMFRLWNMVLINITFTLALFGMFINRGGPVPSVHSFAQSTLGLVFLGFLGFTLVASFAIFFFYTPHLRSNRNLESLLSRESAFLVNNLFLLAVAFITLWGVIYPLISETFWGTRVTVAEPFYNQMNGPLLLALIFLMGIGPLLPWRRAPGIEVLKALRVPLVVVGILISILIAVGIRNPLALLSFAFCAIITTGILREWVHGTRFRHRRGENYALAYLRLIKTNRPRYGGYIVHLAMVFLAIGITGSSFYDIQRDVVLNEGESVTLGQYRIEYIGTTIESRSDRTEYTTMTQLYKGADDLGSMISKRSYYPSFQMASTRPAIRSSPIVDIYVISTELLPDGSASFRLFVTPLVWWMWAGGPMFIIGTIVALWPERRPRLQTSRSQTLTHK